MTATVLLIRHASHDQLDRVLCGRTAGVRLGAHGLAQAADLARGLAAETPAAVFSSPLERAQQTAAPIAAACGLPVRPDEDLNEIDMGAWSGRSFASLHDDPAWALWNTERAQARPPGGETVLDAQGRAAGFLCRMRDAFAGLTVAAVSHAEIIRMALAWCLGLPAGNAMRLDIAPASVSRVLVGDWGSKVLCVSVPVGAP